MRMSPAAPGAMWREAEPGGLMVDGEFIPAGCEIGTCIYAIHHHELYFPDSFTFSPERWLSSSETQHGKLESPMHNSAYNPFSLGPRGCVGRPLALMEISVTVARVIWLMEFRNVEGALETRAPCENESRHYGGEFQLYSHLTSYTKDNFLQFQPATNRESVSNQ